MLCAWQVPDLAVEKFYHAFYMALQNGTVVTEAAKTAQETLKKDDRYDLPTLCILMDSSFWIDTINFWIDTINLG